MSYLTKAQIEEWIDKNTFQCPLGRVSLETCRQMRQRPRFEFAQSTEQHWANQSTTLYMPKECETCTEWVKHDPEGAFFKKICSVAGCSEPAQVKGMCKKHYARWYYHQNKKIGKEIREMSKENNPETYQCRKCGKTFTAWKNGKITIKNYCPDCLRSRQLDAVKKFQEQVQAFKDHYIGNGQLHLDFTAHPDLLRQLEKAAKEHFRTPQLQALFYIVTGLEAGGYRQKR